MIRECECGRHVRADRPYPERRVMVVLETEMVCATPPDAISIAYRPGRRFAVVEIRLPVWVFDVVDRARCWRQWMAWRWKF